MGKITFFRQPDRSRLVITDSKFQAEAMLTIKDFDGKLLPVSTDTQLNTHTGRIFITHDIVRVNPRGLCKYQANIAKITFKGQDLQDSLYIGGAFCKLTFLPLVSAETAGDSDIQQNTVDPLHVAISVSHLDISVQTTP